MVCFLPLLCESCSYIRFVPPAPDLLQQFRANLDIRHNSQPTFVSTHFTVALPNDNNMAMANPSPGPSSPPRLRLQTGRPRRLSKFTEGSELTRPELLQRTPTSNSHFFHILSEMDAHEARKHSPTSPPNQIPSHPHQQHRHSHRNSNSSSTSSVESFGRRSLDKERLGEREFGAKEGRRSITFGRKSLDERPLDISGKMKGFKGRLRAFTGGRVGDVKPYPGT